jgi:hypothetical protein
MAAPGRPAAQLVALVREDRAPVRRRARPGGREHHAAKCPVRELPKARAAVRKRERVRERREQVVLRRHERHAPGGVRGECAGWVDEGGREDLESAVRCRELVLCRGRRGGWRGREEGEEEVRMEAPRSIY